MTILNEYQQANPKSGFHDSWNRFRKLLDEETYFFAPKSYKARAQHSLRLMSESERLEKARQQVSAYHNYFPIKKFFYWLFDVGDISAKRVWVAYSDLWKNVKGNIFTGDVDPTVEQFNTFQRGFNALTPLLNRPWKKVIKNIRHFFSFFSQPENHKKNQQRSAVRVQSDIELVAGELVLAERQNVLASQAAPLNGFSVLTFGSGLSSSAIDRVTKWVSPSETSSQASFSQLTLSSNLSITAPSGFNLSRDDEIRWSYVFICSYFDIDWTNSDKKVVQQDAERSFRKNFALQLHPDKKPEFFKQDWGTRAYWEKKVAEARKGEFDLVVEMREALLMILKDNEIADLKWSNGNAQILLQAVKQGNELRDLTFRLVQGTEGIANAELQLEEVIREREQYKREREEYKRERERYKREGDECERQANECSREADEIQGQLDELKKNRKKRLLRRQFAKMLEDHGYDMNSELVQKVLADPENFKNIFENHVKVLQKKQAVCQQTEQQISTCSSAESVSSDQALPPDAISAKAFVNRTSTSGFLDKPTGYSAHLENDEQQPIPQASFTSA